MSIKTQEIERKFLITSLPDLTGLKAISYERRWISLTPTTEIRIQHKGDLYQLQRKVQGEGSVENVKQTFTVTSDEYTQLKHSALHNQPILRICYKYDTTTKISIYRGHLEGLMRAEIEFETIEEAKNYTPLVWMGREITDEKEERDRNLIEI